MFNLFKKKTIGKNGNYIKPEKLSEAEKKRMKAYNLEHVFREVYVPNKRLEELIGMSLLTNNARFCRELTNAELDEAYFLLVNEISLFTRYKKVVKEAFAPIKTEWNPKYEEYIKSICKKNKPPYPVVDDPIFSVPKLREMFIQTREEYELSHRSASNKDSADNEDVAPLSADNRKEKIAAIEKLIDFRNAFEIAISDLLIYQIRMRANFYGASVALYDIY
jgi:hypothetical protein